jgi:CDGSH-type Zn-finger protein
MSTTKPEEKKPKENEIKIEIAKNGPYLVTGKIPIYEQIIFVDEEGIPVEWKEGQKYPEKEKCGLCRCGQTKTKPYCDGSHVKANFDGTENAGFETYEQNAKVFDGPELKLTDVEHLCASARFCHREGEIWNLVPKSDQPRAKQVATEEACDCPSGRLVVWDKKTSQPIEPKLEKSIGLIEDPQLSCSGPIWVRGGISIKSSDGHTYEVRNRVTLCRCGKSTIKPFCDSSHFPEHKYKELMESKKQNAKKRQ